MQNKYRQKEILFFFPLQNKICIKLSESRKCTFFCFFVFTEVGLWLHGLFKHMAVMEGNYQTTQTAAISQHSQRCGV